MLNFEEEFNKLLENDPLGLLKEKLKVSAVISPDNRLKASFEEINKFIDDTKKKPTKSRDINERRLFSRLENLRESPEKAVMLLELDKHNLLNGIERPEPLIIETIDDVLDNDPLGLLGGARDDAGKNIDIFDLTNLPSQSRTLTDFVAKRKPCKNFAKYEEQFITVQSEIKENKRRLVDFKNTKDALVENNYYVLDGVLLYLEKKDITSKSQTIKGIRFREDGRTRCIFENGTESNMLSRSLAKALDLGGKTVTQTEEQINKEFHENLGEVKEEDKLVGYIYILKSLSKNIEIQSLQNLYKVGFSTTTVEKRIANAKNETTYLMSPVKIIAEYEAYNMNTQKFEKLLHTFFNEVCLDLKITDNKGKAHQPREWFIAPLETINQAIKLIINNQIHHYLYNPQLKEIIKK